MHDTNERASERLGTILDLPSPTLAAKAGLDVWQAYGLHWFLCEIVGFVVRGPSADDDDDDELRVKDLAYSMRRWCHELRADEPTVTEGFRVLKSMGILRVEKEKGMIRVGIIHLEAYADRVWNPKRTTQQRERRATKKRDSESATSQLGADSSRKEVRKTRKGKEVRTTTRTRTALRAGAPVGGAALGPARAQDGELDIGAVPHVYMPNSNMSFLNTLKGIHYDIVMKGKRAKDVVKSEWIQFAREHGFAITDRGVERIAAEMENTDAN